MEKLKLKMAVCTFTLCVLLFCLSNFAVTGSNQSSEKTRQFEQKPNINLIDEFDNAMQKRFLTKPRLGIRRIGPQPNPHLETFKPETDEEKTSVANFQKDNWKVGLYLFGRQAREMFFTKNGQEQKKLYVSNRLNSPLPITEKLKVANLTKPAKLLDHVKIAFQTFQQQSTYEFNIGERGYVARPVRAVNKSCLECHTDFFITDIVDKRTYKYRQRRVGDTIGVLVYSFEKAN